MEQINHNYTSIINCISRDLGIIASYDQDLNALKDFKSEHQKIRKRVTVLFELAFKSIDKNEIETANDMISLSSYQNIYYDGFDKSATIREQVVPVVRNFIQSAKVKYTLVDESPFA